MLLSAFVRRSMDFCVARVDLLLYVFWIWINFIVFFLMFLELFVARVLGIRVLFRYLSSNRSNMPMKRSKCRLFGIKVEDGWLSF
ncbi:hypothetical protein HanPI659440_Chr16g0635781 [Helianthus annuus]|nr:hypothetical protein HanPI659440_Chr16g0635781 [Helianthus annuus]